MQSYDRALELWSGNSNRLARTLAGGTPPSNTVAAVAAAGRADLLAGQLGDAMRQLKIKAEIGAIELSAGDLQAAYTAYQGALALIKRTPEPTTEGYVWSDLGVLYTLMQEPQQARNALDQAMQIWNSTRIRQAS